MRFYLDCEFIERGGDDVIDLVSLAVVSETGQEFYAERVSANLQRASEWFRVNVQPSLLGGTAKMIDEDLRVALLAFLDRCDGSGAEFEFWGYFSDYDWVVLCQFFGAMDELPPRFPYYCRDLKQKIDRLRSRFLEIDLPATPESHNALEDARWIRAAHRDLMAWGI